MCPPTQIQKDKKIRCTLVHDHLLLRQGVKRLLEDEPDVSVVAEASSAEEALRQAFEHRPEVVIAGTEIFECPAEQSERLILKESPGSRVVFLTGEPAKTAPSDDGSGKAKYTARKTSAEELVGLLRKTVAAERLLEREADDAAEVAAWPAEKLPRRRVLTGREREVLKLLAEGRTVRSAAGILGLSIKTVDAHKFNLMRKLGIHNKAELVIWAIQMKVVKLPVNF